MKVYVIGSTGSDTELARAKRWTDRLARVPGVEVISTWLEVVAAEGAGNPRSASREQRVEWSSNDIKELLAANLVWFLVPPVATPTRGAWFEFGTAEQAGLHVIVSGDTRQSIFCALAGEFEDDIDAFIEIVRLACRKHNN
jgi:hypothetical protein